MSYKFKAIKDLKVEVLYGWCAGKCTWCQSDERTLCRTIESRGRYCNDECAQKDIDHERRRRLGEFGEDDKPKCFTCKTNVDIHGNCEKGCN